MEVGIRGFGDEKMGVGEKEELRMTHVCLSKWVDKGDIC